MIGRVMHIGVTVSDMKKSKHFYQDILGLDFKGELLMSGQETETLFNSKNTKAKVAYFNGSNEIIAPPIELIQFIDDDIDCRLSNLKRTSISEICFQVKNIDEVYKYLINNHVECLSAPQAFDFSKYGFSKSKALYFKDPDGIILELMEIIE